MSLNLPSEQLRITRRSFLFGGAAAVTGVGAYSYGPGRQHLDVIYHEVFIPDLPSAFEGFRIAQLSDFHFGHFPEASILENAIEKVNAMKPDMVALTGDFITFNHTSHKKNVDAANECASILTGLRVPILYASHGNHDAEIHSDLLPILNSRKIELLRNEHVPLDHRGDRIWLAGLADVLMDKPDPSETLPSSQDGQPVIMLGHEPDYADNVSAFARANNRRCDLYLAGHTHGGQINIPGLRRFALPGYGTKYVHGPFQINETLLYVNRGLGTIHLPMRFNAPPEVTLFKLRSKAG